MKPIALSIFLILFISIAFAQPKQETTYLKKIDYQIDWKYKAGNFLIFDCDRGHYACVDKDGDNNCREERNFAMEKKLSVYPCAPLKQFTTKETCLIKNYEVMDSTALKRFCYPDR